MSVKNIIVTGGSGFLMKNFIEDHGAQYNIISPRSSHVNWITGEGVDTLPKESDVFIHSAAIYGGLVFNQKYSKQILLDNTKMSVNVFEYLLKYPPKKVILIGSACLYPGNATGYFTEDMLGDGKLDKSVELYAISKLWHLAAGEKLLENWNQLVLANMYGPYDHQDLDRSHVAQALITKFIKAKNNNTDVHLLGTGEPKRSLVYVKDVIDVIKYFVDNNVANGAYNVGHDHGISIRQLAETIAKQVGFNGKIFWGDDKDNGAMSKILDYTKLDQIYPNRKKTDLSLGIKETLLKL